MLTLPFLNFYKGLFFDCFAAFASVGINNFMNFIRYTEWFEHLESWKRKFLNKSNIER